MIADLDRRRLAATVSDGNRDYMSINYAYDLGGIATLEPGWRSAFANAGLIFGLLDFFEATGEHRYLDGASRYVSALTENLVDNPLSRPDEAQYLWFEEYLAIGGRPTRVMNGHIVTLFALVRYWQVSGDDSIKPIVQAGLATALRYMWDVRNPGQTSRYWLFDRHLVDYGPSRMVSFADQLFKLTRYPAFRDVWNNLKTDMPIP